MPIRIVQLGTPRHPDEGLRIGTVRRPPRGVPKERFAADNWYDVWYPNLSPTPETVKLGQQALADGGSGKGSAKERDKNWTAFIKQFRKEMAAPDASKTLDLLAALSRQTWFSVGCYCEDEARCHRSVLRALLVERGAEVVD